MWLSLVVVIVVVYSRNLPLCYVKIRFFIDEMLLMMLLLVFFVVVVVVVVIVVVVVDPRNLPLKLD